MIIADLAKLPGGTFPARRWGRGLVGQLGQPIAAKGFSMGYSILEPKGGQVPWHNQEQEEVYFIVPDKCTECTGFHEEPQCAAVCPVDCCVPDPDHEESVEVLLDRKERLHL